VATEDQRARLTRWGAAYELLPHAHTESAFAEAQALGLEPDDVAKTLIVKTLEGYLQGGLIGLCRFIEATAPDSTMPRAVRSKALRARPEGAPPAHLALTDSGAPASLNGLRPKAPPARTTLMRLAAKPSTPPSSLRCCRDLREVRRASATRGEIRDATVAASVALGEAAIPHSMRARAFAQ
jgi:hypothetical protein